MLLAEKLAEPHNSLSKCLITRQHVVIYMTEFFLLLLSQIHLPSSLHPLLFCGGSKTVQGGQA